MGFSIGRFLGAIAGPVVGLATGNPALGLAISGAASAGFADDAARAATVGRQTQSGPISVNFPSFDPQFQGGPFIRPSQVGPQAGLGREIIRGLGGVGTGIAVSPLFRGGNGAKTQLQLILARARAATGGAVTRNKIIDAAKVCGLETAASTFGLSVNDVCMVVVKGRTRRRRGVSAADIRRTKRTIGFASRIRKDLKALAR